MTISRLITQGIVSLLILTLLTACDRHTESSPKTDSREPVQLTAWTSRTEAFVEYLPPEGQAAGTVIIHLTRLTDWKPLPAATVRLIMTPVAGNPVRIEAKPAETPGIYRAEVQLPPGGKPHFALAVSGTGFSETIDLAPAKHERDHAGEHGKHTEGPNHQGDHDGHDDAKAEAKKRTGHPDHDGTPHPAEKGTEPHADHGDHGAIGSITLSKPQQWAVEFQVAEPRHERLATSFTVAGELVPATTGERVVAAPLAGIISPARPLPYPGKRVARGEVIAVIEPPVIPGGGATQLIADHAQAKSRLTLAQAEYDRASRLVAAKIAARRRLEEAEAALLAAKAALTPLESSLKSVHNGTDGKVVVRAPIAGTIMEVTAANGSGVGPGQSLVRIVDTGTLWLKVNLPASERGKLGQPHAATTTFAVAGLPGEFRTATLVSEGAMVDPQTRTMPLLFSVANRSGQLKAGMFAQATLRTGATKETLTVPRQALFEDEGRWFVFVQVTGITFDRREVQIGAEERGLVAVTSGLDEHDRVVTKGGYYVKLAGQGGATADPHAGHGH